MLNQLDHGNNSSDGSGESCQARTKASLIVEIDDREESSMEVEPAVMERVPRRRSVILRVDAVLLLRLIGMAIGVVRSSLFSFLHDGMSTCSLFYFDSGCSFGLDHLMMMIPKRVWWSRGFSACPRSRVVAKSGHWRGMAEDPFHVSVALGGRLGRGGGATRRGSVFVRWGVGVSSGKDSCVDPQMVDHV
jgi:hypothetical protein